jgi:CheY-like chemotaxis protein
MDTTLPGRLGSNSAALNGHDIARALREQFGGAITLIAITGIKRPSEHIAALFAGFNHYLTKPYQRETLLQMLARTAENA